MHLMPAYGTLTLKLWERAPLHSNIIQSKMSRSVSRRGACGTARLSARGQTKTNSKVLSQRIRRQQILLDYTDSWIEMKRNHKAFQKTGDKATVEQTWCLVRHIRDLYCRHANEGSFTFGFLSEFERVWGRSFNTEYQQAQTPIAPAAPGAPKAQPAR